MRSFPTPSWVALDQTHVWHPFTPVLGSTAPLPVVRAEGVYLHTAEGRAILDGISSWWVNIHGHNHPRLNQALKDQLDCFAHVLFAGFTHEPAARLAHALSERTHHQLPHVFFTDNGSTAVEAALKMAYQFWRHRNEPQRTTFIGLTQAYHGDTFGAMATGDVAVFHRHFSDVLFRVARAEPTAASISAILDANPHHIAAVIVEPMVQGAGGMRMWPATELQRIREITQSLGIPLIADEIFTGFGRTGKFFACEHAEIMPDIMCLSKGISGGYLPLAVTLANDRIFEAYRTDDPAKTFFHGHSYTGNALACAVALESLRVFDDTQCLDRVQRLESLFTARLQHLADHPWVHTTRCLGGIAVIELTQSIAGGGYLDHIGRCVTDHLLQHHDILLRPLGNVLYFIPPYVITDAEVHRVFDAIEATLRSLHPTAF